MTIDSIKNAIVSSAQYVKQEYLDKPYGVAKSDLKSLIDGSSFKAFYHMDAEEKADTILKTILVFGACMLLGLVCLPAAGVIGTLAAIFTFAHLTNRPDLLGKADDKLGQVANAVIPTDLVQ